MSWLQQMARKAYTPNPPFWSMDALRFPMLGSVSHDGRSEGIDNDFEGFVCQAYRDNGVVFACVLSRLLLFSEARFMWRRFRDGKPGDLFASPGLSLLERPGPNWTTGELLARMETDVSMAGNFYATTADNSGKLGASATGEGRRIVRMRPDWVTILSGSVSGVPNALDTKVLMYVYKAPGQSEEEAVKLLPSEVCHYSPIPDPMAHWRGMSWITPVLREIEADKAATVHKGKFFKNGATPNLSVTLDAAVKPDAFKRWMELFKEAHQGADNAYKTLYLGGGADVKPLSADFRQLDFKLTQGAGETRIAAASGVPPIIVGLSEGLQSATYSNYGQARRRFADGTMRPLWRIASASLETLVASPGPDAALWYDTRDISFLREDQKDLAEIQASQAATIRSLIEAGFTPESAVAAVKAEDYSLLVHSGLISVQLQPAGQAGTNPPTQEA